MCKIISNSNTSNILPLEIRNCRGYDDFKRTAKARYFNVANERLKCGNTVKFNCYYHIVIYYIN